MAYTKDHVDQNLREISAYVASRSVALKGKDRIAISMEFKEWLDVNDLDPDDIWTIPDLTDEGLLDFFKRAISQD
tara:strand:- start:21 stop:245 length:225 start_codon:yes stop_codon:yes gene_type:complete